MSSLRAPGGPVVVGVDGSRPASAALSWAVEEAAARRVPLRLVHVHPRPEPGGLEPPDERRARLLHAARAVLAEAAEQARASAARSGADVPIQPCLREGVPAAGLLAAAEDAQLVVLGSRGMGGVAGLLVGSVSDAVAAGATCPVVVVRRAAASSGPVVVGIDGSPASVPALGFAMAEAAARGAPLLAVHAWRDGLIDPAWAHLFDWDAIEEYESAVLAECLAGWGSRYPDVELVRLVTRDAAAHALVAQSERAQLVVVGSHGRGPLGRLVLGSVSRAVLHRAACPVAVVHPDRRSGDETAFERGEVSLAALRAGDLSARW